MALVSFILRFQKILSDKIPTCNPAVQRKKMVLLSSLQIGVILNDDGPPFDWIIRENCWTESEFSFFIFHQKKKVKKSLGGNRRWFSFEIISESSLFLEDQYCVIRNHLLWEEEIEVGTLVCHKSEQWCKSGVMTNGLYHPISQSLWLLLQRAIFISFPKLASIFLLSRITNGTFS